MKMGRLVGIWFRGNKRSGNSPPAKTAVQSRDRIGKNARSAIVHNRSAESTPFTNGAAFVTGFELARRSLFKMLREGVPDDWDSLGIGDA